MIHLTDIRIQVARLLCACVVVLAAAQSTAAQTLTATLTYPANGAVNADMVLPFQWTTVANVQVYYLYVGTTPGAADVINSGELVTTSYQAPVLPVGQTLYVRLWTAIGGAWRYVDSTFTAAAVTTPRLLTPANGAVGANVATQAITWSSVPNVQAYYLYVGTTQGANDVVNTGETLATAYVASGIPANVVLYARIWAKVGGVWRYRDSTFSAAYSPPLMPTLTYPFNGGVNLDLSQAFQWTPITNVQAYYLYVGTAPGATNLVNSGELQKPSYVVNSLPAGALLYARIWAKVGGVWRYRDSTFSTAAAGQGAPTLLYPANGETHANLSVPITWTDVPQAQAFNIYVGSTLGANDLLDSGTLASPRYLAPYLPTGQTLYVRLWARIGGATGGVWRSSDYSFTADPPAPVLARLTYPANGTEGADLSQPIQWTTVAGAESYKLWIGTSIGTFDLLDTGDLQTTSFAASTLTPQTWLYARMWTRVGGVWRYTDSTFLAAAPAATISYPLNGATNADLTLPVQWMPLLGASAEFYRLYLGTTPGANDLADSGSTRSTSFLATTVPIGQTVYARVLTEVGGVWRYSDSSFTAAARTLNDTMITFDTLSPVMTSFVSYTESGFNVSAFDGSWRGRNNILFDTPAVRTTAGQVKIVAVDGTPFRLNSVDVYSSVTPIPYTITGFRNDTRVFTTVGTVGNTFGAFKTVVNPYAATVVDAVIIGLTAPAACCSNAMGLDNISLSQ